MDYLIQYFGYAHFLIEDNQIHIRWFPSSPTVEPGYEVKGSGPEAMYAGIRMSSFYCPL